MDTQFNRARLIAVFPLPHRPRVIARQQAAAHEDTQQAPAHALRHRGDGWRIETGGGVEDNPAGGGGDEYPNEGSDPIFDVAVPQVVILRPGLTAKTLT